ncbi:3D domain-containing protein [Exiguobacterium sp. 17-1]|uniref:3D domain-containing protein n=1 Tax=Exiguobacterium TaxID=33986 RepID=UPI0024957B7E|nr:3D domain-containing protein [Exiguobacterium sp. 17-1]
MIRSITYMTIGCILLLVASLLYVMMDHPRDVTIMVDGRQTKIETLETSVFGVLQEAGISVRSQDVIEPALSADLPKNDLIVIQPAKEITLIMGYGEARTIRTQARRVDDLLKEQGISQMLETDDVYPSKEAVLTSGMTVRYREAFPIELIVEGKAREVYTYQTTVRELLSMQGVKLQTEDKVMPGLDTVVAKDMLVTVNTTRRAVLTEQQLLPFEVETVEDDTLPAGEQLVTKSGRPGIRTQKYQLTLADGLSKEKKLIANEVTSEPVKQVVKVGTKPVEPVEAAMTPTPTFDTEKATVPLAEVPKAATDLDFSKAKTLMVEATAYTNDPASNGSQLYDGRALTATGYDVTDTITYQGLPIIAVDPKVIPLGTKVYVEGVGLAIALDTGGAIKGNKIDVLVEGESTAKQFGRKTIQVWVIPNDTTEAGT